MNRNDHIIKLQKYRPSPSKINLGTVDSYGVERLILAPDESWSGLAIKATFNIPNGTNITVIADGNIVNVPHEATQVSENPVSIGSIVFSGYEDGAVKHSVNLTYTVDWHDDTDGDNEGEITPTVLEQILSGENSRNEAEKIREQNTELAIQNAVSVADEIAKKAASGAFDGKDGDTPDIKIGTVETLNAGEKAYVEIVGPKESPILNLGIPSGSDAESPVKSVNGMIGDVKLDIPEPYDDTEIKKSIAKKADSSALDSYYNKTEVDKKLSEAGKVKSVNGMTGDVKLDIPKRTSELTNDSHFVNKDYVDDSVAKNSAYYISNNGEPFNSVEELLAYSGKLTNNDYAMVVSKDSKGISTYTQYKYSADTKTWAKEFSFENGSFTSEQWAALSSGITAKLVSDFSEHIRGKSNPHGVSYQQLLGVKPTYTAEEVGALPDTTTIPPDLSDDVSKLEERMVDVVYVDPYGEVDPEGALEAVTAEEFDQKMAKVSAELTEQKQEIDGKLTEPTGAQVGQFFRVASIDADGHYVLEAVDAPSGGVTDVQVTGVSVVQDGVANLPIIDNNEVFGLARVKTNGDYGIKAHNSYLQTQTATAANIDSRTFAYRTIGTANLDYAVKAAMCDDKGAAWTAEEQAAARQRLGLDSIVDTTPIFDYTLVEDGENVQINFGTPLRNYIEIRLSYNGNNTIPQYAYTYFNGSQVAGTDFTVNGGSSDKEAFRKFYIWNGFVFGFGATVPPDYITSGSFEFLAKNVKMSQVEQITILSRIASNPMRAGLRIQVWGV